MLALFIANKAGIKDSFWRVFLGSPVFRTWYFHLLGISQSPVWELESQTVWVWFKKNSHSAQEL